MRAVADHRDAARVDRLDRAHRVALDARDLDEAANGITGQAEIMLHADLGRVLDLRVRSEEHTSELQSLMRISYAVFCLKKKKNTKDSRQYIANTHKTI